MAYWGIAMTWYHPIWAPPNAKELAAGLAAAQKAAKLAAKTEREQGYIEAIGIFYQDTDHRPTIRRAHWPIAVPSDNSQNDCPTITKRRFFMRCRCSVRRRRTT